MRASASNEIVDVEEIAAHMVAESGPDMAWPADVLTSVAKKRWLLADTDGDREVTREELRRFRGEAVTP